MKLKKYLKENKITQNEFIKHMESETGLILSQGGLSKYMLGDRIPRKSEMHAIYKATKFKVSANDFYDLESTTNNLPITKEDKYNISNDESAEELARLKILYQAELIDRDIYKDMLREILRSNDIVTS